MRLLKRQQQDVNKKEGVTGDKESNNLFVLRWCMSFHSRLAALHVSNVLHA